MELQESHETAGIAIERAGAEDRSRLDFLIATNYPGLRSMISRTVRDRALANDLLNEAVVIACEHLRSGRIAQRERIAGYVYQVALNLLRNYRRKLSERDDRRAGTQALDMLASADTSDKERLEAQIATRVRDLVDGLPTARDREIVTRFYLDEDDKDAICRDLGLSPLHFDKVIFRARQRMKSLLEARGFDKRDFFSILLACLGSP
jgi:RNA polymerase sigma-70 factor (ECF subfamily)